MNMCVCTQRVLGFFCLETSFGKLSKEEMHQCLSEIYQFPPKRIGQSLILYTKIYLDLCLLDSFLMLA